MKSLRVRMSLVFGQTLKVPQGVRLEPPHLHLKGFSQENPFFTRPDIKDLNSLFFKMDENRFWHEQEDALDIPEKKAVMPSNSSVSMNVSRVMGSS